MGPSKMSRLIELNVAYIDNEKSAVKAMKDYWAGAFILALFDQNI